MGLRETFAEALPDIFTEAGEEAVFNPAAGDPIPCHIFINISRSFDPPGMESQVYHRTVTIEALLSEIGREPVAGETFTWEGNVYEVVEPLENDELMVTVQAKRL